MKKLIFIRMICLISALSMIIASSAHSKVIFKSNDIKVELTENDALKIISEAINSENYWEIPTGTLSIANAMAEKINKTSGFKIGRQYKLSYYKNFLEKFEQINLIKISQNKVVGGGRFLGDKSVEVHLTEKGQGHITGQPNDEGVYKIKMGEVYNLKILKAEPYFNNYFDSDNVYVLIYYTANFRWTDIGSELTRATNFPVYKNYKGKSLLSCEKVFGKEYKYLMRDVGDVDSNTWRTNRIPNNEYR